LPDPISDLQPPAGASDLRRRTYVVIFRHDTRAGWLFDVVLIASIMASVAVIMLESVASIRAEHRALLLGLEWFFTGAFTVEYVLRLWCVGAPWRYARSFLGIIDLLAVLPTYLSLFIPGGQALAVVRILRVLRVFRILKLVQYVGEARLLGEALRASRIKITVFVMTVLTLVVVVGSLMYLIEGPDAGFTSIPVGVYWGVVTLTTVGFGDITPLTPVGQALAAFVMILGYGIIAVPTGIVSVELAHATSGAREAQARRLCEGCGRKGHDVDALYCKWCGGTVQDPSDTLFE
jgi:voltage-gated potassium channel